MGTALWVDASVGVAGDMLAGALVDAGVPLTSMREAVDAVVPGLVELSASAVMRAGLRATKFDVRVLELDAPHRHLSTIRQLLAAASLDDGVRTRIERVFTRLAEVEADAHGVDVEDVHFHEVGAADSIADVVAVCAGLHWLGVDELTFSTIELGSGSVEAAHGRVPVPTPAAVRLVAGCRVTGDLRGEAATPTGLALLTALGTQAAMPAMRLTTSGSGAGGRDPQEYANVTRVVMGDVEDRQLLLEANIDDMDPRLWPSAIAAILEAGARDAWLTPIVMKKGRPAHTLSVLCKEDAQPAIEEAVFRSTTTIGLRRIEMEKVALDRAFARVSVAGHAIAVKLAGRMGRVYNVSIEWEDVARAAEALALAPREVLARATSAAEAAGLVVGSALPTA